MVLRRMSAVLAARLPRRQVKTELKAAAYGLIASLLILVLDPFNLSRGAAFAGELYGHHFAVAQSVASAAGAKILVVIADDDYLIPHRSYEQPVSWPLAWPIWAEAIEAAADARARVILLDVVLLDDRPAEEVERTVAKIETASRRSTILLAVAPSGSQAFRRIHPALLALARRDPNVKLVSVLRATTAGPFETYAAAGDGPVESAAVVLARRLCNTQPARSEFCKGGGFPSVMELQWRRPAVQNCAGIKKPDRIAAGCAGLGGGGVGRLLGLALSGTLNGALRDGCGKRGQPICIAAPLGFKNYPVPYASLGQLLSGLPHDEASAASGGAVLIGQNFASAEDLAETPIHGKLPGVFLHAVAAENLLVPGGGLVSRRPCARAECTGSVE